MSNTGGSLSYRVRGWRLESRRVSKDFRACRLKVRPHPLLITRPHHPQPLSAVCNERARDLKRVNSQDSRVDALL